MSTFRIERIDQGQPDEWIPRLNDDGAQIGDDVVAEDVNELSEGILATQTELLKSNLYAPSSLLDSDEGIAARLKYMEETAGQATLQDVYENGNIINVQPGKNLLLGGNGELTLDDIGNLTFSPTTMRVKGLGASYLGFTDNSMTTYLSDLNVGANSSGYSLTLTSGEEITLKDNNLSNAVSLSEYGETALATTAQSLVGAINELKNGTFSNSLQSIYDQSASGRILTNATNGPFRIENGSGNPLLSALNVIGSISASDAVKTDSLEVGTDSTWDDASGLETNTKIKTTNYLESPLLKNSGTLSIQDNRILLTLSELGVSSLDTSSQSIAGAINELKTSIDSVGGTASKFANEHSTLNGMHEIITTQAGLGDDLVERLIIRNSSGVKQMSVNALGHIVAQRLNLAGVAVEDAITDLLNHMAGDGQDHSSVLNHLNSNNPHNVVGELNGLTGNISLVGASGIAVNQSGNSLIVSSSTTYDLQAVYDAMALGSLVIDTDTSKNLYFRNSSNEILFSIADDFVHVKRDLQMGSLNNQIISQSNIDVQATSELNLESTGSNVTIQSDSASSVIVDGVEFSDAISSSLDPLLPQTVVGAINKVQNEELDIIENTFPYTITAGMILTKALLNPIDVDNVLIRPIADFHPINADQKFFGKKLNGNMFVAIEDILPGQTGKVAKGGTVTADGIVRVGVTPLIDWAGSQLFLSPQGNAEVILQDVALLANGDVLTLDVGGIAKTYTGNTAASDHPNGVFRISTAGTLNRRSQDTVIDLMNAINTQSYSQGVTPINVIALLDGAASKGYIRINDNSLVISGELIQLTVGLSDDPDFQSVTLTCTDDPALLTNNKFLRGNTEEETAHYLANAINRTMIEHETVGIVREDLFNNSINVTLRDYATNSNGHGYRAKAIGKTVFLERKVPGFLGNDTTLLASTAGMITSNPSGGMLKLRVYNQDRSRTSLPNSFSNTSAMVVNNMPHSELFETDYLEEKITTDEEATFLFLYQDRAKVADVLEASPTTAKIFLNMTSGAL